MPAYCFGEIFDRTPAGKTEADEFLALHPSHTRVFTAFCGDSIVYLIRSTDRTVESGTASYNVLSAELTEASIEALVDAINDASDYDLMNLVGYNNILIATLISYPLEE